MKHHWHEATGRDSCKTQFNGINERQRRKIGCFALPGILSRYRCNFEVWYRMMAKSFNNVISPKDLEFLRWIGNKLLQLSLCSVVAVTRENGKSGGGEERRRRGRRRRWRRKIFALSPLFFHDTTEAVLPPTFYSYTTYNSLSCSRAFQSFVPCKISSSYSRSFRFNHLNAHIYCFALLKSVK